MSVAGLACYRPGARSRLFYRLRVHRGRKGERRDMSEAGYAALVTAAHTQLAAPVILIWDNLNAHISARMRAWIEARADWLTVERLPAYAPELNAVAGAWAHTKNSRIVRHGAPDASLPCRAAIVPPRPGLLRRGYPPSPPADRLAAAQGQPRAGAGGNCR